MTGYTMYSHIVQRTVSLNAFVNAVAKCHKIVGHSKGPGRLSATLDQQTHKVVMLTTA